MFLAGDDQPTGPECVGLILFTSYCRSHGDACFITRAALFGFSAISLLDEGHIFLLKDPAVLPASGQPPRWLQEHEEAALVSLGQAVGGGGRV